MKSRLQKILSTAGVSSRRAGEKLILEGRISVNGKTITELGTKADPESDDIRIDGRRINVAARRLYILLNKPRGYITSRSDPQQRRTVVDLLREHGIRDYVYPVGRLDYDSEGLLLLTSDGDLAARLTHPRHGVPREYEVQVRGVPDHHDLDRLQRGILMDGRKTAPATAKLLRVFEKGAGHQALVSLVIHEGRNRQVRRMCDAIGHPVIRLRRVRIGPIADARLKPGGLRELSSAEIAALKKAAAEPVGSTSPRRHLNDRAASPRNERAAKSHRVRAADRLRRA
jgi:23S rRNA pseudouridine2605 synthase